MVRNGEWVSEEVGSVSIRMHHNVASQDFRYIYSLFYFCFGASPPSYTLEKHCLQGDLYE